MFHFPCLRHQSGLIKWPVARQERDRQGWLAERISRRRNLNSRKMRTRGKRGTCPGPEARQLPARHGDNRKVRYMERKGFFLFCFVFLKKSL